MTAAKSDFTVNGVTGQYRTLSIDEWAYLFNSRTVNGGTGKNKSYSHSITYGDVSGVVLYPDNYAGTVLSGTVETLPQGVVFLPAAGERSNYGVGYFTNGHYWSSSSPYFLDDIFWAAKSVYFYFASTYYQESVEIPAEVELAYGSCVRLVTDVE